MNKIYKFLAVMTTVVCFAGWGGLKAQTIWSEDFNALTEVGTQQCGASNGAIDADLANLLQSTYEWSGSKIYPSDGKIKLGTGSAQGWIQVSGIAHPTASVMALTFDARIWFKANEKSNIHVIINGQSSTIALIASTSAEDCVLHHYSLNFSAPITEDLTIRIEAAESAGNRFYLDNLVVESVSAPSISFAPETTGENFENVGMGTSKTINYVATGFNLDETGSTTIALEGSNAFSTPAAATVSNADLANGETIAITYTPVEAGSDTATITFTNSDLTLSFPIVGTCLNGIATLAELRALMDYSNAEVDVTGSETYLYTGHAIVTEKTTNSAIWIQDATAAIQIFSQGGAMIADATVGTEVTNITGKLCNYFGNLELKPTVNITDIDHFPSIVIEPQSITLAQLTDRNFMNDIQGKLVRLENVTFNETGEFAGYVIYSVNQGEMTDSAIYFTSNYDPMVHASIPTTAVDVIGVNICKAIQIQTPTDTIRLASRYYVLPREMTEPTGIAENEMSSVKIYPNPTSDNVTIELNEPATGVAIYNVFGKLVGSESLGAGSHVIKMRNLTAGVYFLRIFNDNQVIGTAKVVRN